MRQKKRFGLYLFVLVLAGALVGSGFQMTMASKESSVRMIPENFSDLAETVRPGVVNIRTVINPKGGGPVFDHFFEVRFNPAKMKLL